MLKNILTILFLSFLSLTLCQEPFEKLTQNLPDFNLDLPINLEGRVLLLPAEQPGLTRVPRTYQDESFEWEYESGEEYEYEYVEGLWNEYDPVEFAETADENNSEDDLIQGIPSGPIIYLPDQQPNFINNQN